MKNFKLCYIEGAFAYFTTQDLAKQTGDDWDDVPYEHNAGSPYEDWDNKENPEWEIETVAFTGDFSRPCDYHLNSPYSVDDINRGAVAWLVGSDFNVSKVIIMAGTSLEEFIKKIREGQGEVYVKFREV